MNYIYHYCAVYQFDGKNREIGDGIISLPFEVIDNDTYNKMKTAICLDSRYPTVQITSLQLLKFTP